MKKLKVDQDKCIGCGTCSALVPKVFKLDDDGKAEVVDPQGDSQEEIEKAIDSCPVGVISQGE